MGYVSPEQIARAREMDLVTYLRTFEPDELVRLGPDSYCTRTHDSLKISNGLWHWFSRNTGGKNALEYLMTVKEMAFPDAVELLTGEPAIQAAPRPAPKKEQQRILRLPPKNDSTERVERYLQGRGILPSVITHCIEKEVLYESADYHNAVFIGKDKSGTPKYAALRSTLGSTFKQDASGSDKRYSFRLLTKEPKDTVHLFEAAIDLLSYATHLKCEGKDYRKENLLSLSGVYQPKKELSESKVPIALSTYLKENPQIKTVVLHLDNDKTGRLCTAALKELLQKEYKIVDDPTPVGKDFNDFLLSYLGISRPKSVRERSDAR